MMTIIRAMTPTQFSCTTTFPNCQKQAQYIAATAVTRYVALLLAFLRSQRATYTVAASCVVDNIQAMMCLHAALSKFLYSKQKESEEIEFTRIHKE